MFECDICKQTFISKGNLIIHQRSAKYCLAQRTSQNASISAPILCSFCNKEYSTVSNLRTHQKKCSAIKQHNEDAWRNKAQEYEALLKSKDVELFEAKMQAQAAENALLKQELHDLKAQLERRMDDITDIARQTKTKTNNTNIQINNAAPLDLNNIAEIRAILEEHLDINVLAAGQKGLARMLKDRYLTDENGQKRYRCTDANRGNFEFHDPNGHLERDPKCAKLREALVKSEIRDFAYERGDKYWKKEDGSTDILKFDTLSGPVQEVAMIANDDTKLRTELSVIMCS